MCACECHRYGEGFGLCCKECRGPAISPNFKAKPTQTAARNTVYWSRFGDSISIIHNPAQEFCYEVVVFDRHDETLDIECSPHLGDAVRSVVKFIFQLENRIPEGRL